MSKEKNIGEEVGVSTQKYKSPAVLSGDASMVLLTWITFFLLLAVLQKYAWKPILKMLDQREDDLRKAIEQADEIKEELNRISKKEATVLREAEQKSQQIIEESRKAAKEAAVIISNKAKQDSQILLENARREISNEVAKAQSNLREESAQFAIDLAGKIIEENLDTEKNKKLVNRLIKEI